MNSLEYHREYNLRRYHRIRKQFIEVLGGLCVRCGATEHLEFDHIDPSTKSFEIGTKMLSYNITTITEEIQKCQLLCSACHDIKSIYDCGNVPREFAKHGSTTMYTHNKCKCDTCREERSRRAVIYKKRYKEKLSLGYAVTPLPS